MSTLLLALRLRSTQKPVRPSWMERKCFLVDSISVRWASYVFPTFVFKRTYSESHLSATYERLANESVSQEDHNGLHQSVMKHECLQYLCANNGGEEGGVFIDCTFGAGGHTKEILDMHPKNKVYALDRDPFAIDLAKKLLENPQYDYRGRLFPILTEFRNIKSVLPEGLVVNGVLFDLGCSSMQLDTAERGFSFRFDGPLDMRMSHCPLKKLNSWAMGDCIEGGASAGVENAKVRVGDDGIYHFDSVEATDWGLDEEDDGVDGEEKVHYYDEMDEAKRELELLKNNQITAADVVNRYDCEDLIDIFRTYGEERYSKKIAKAICRHREEEGDITTTGDLVEIVKNSVPAKYLYGKIHPATRVFQALRVHVNQEFTEIEEGVFSAIEMLEKGGRAVVLSFHRLEDSIVKRAMASHCFPERERRKRDKIISRFDIGFIIDQEKEAKERLSIDKESLPLGEKANSTAIVPSATEIDGSLNAKNYVMVTGKRALTPSKEEVRINPRSRSALLRVVERVT
eukprot:Nk52_evm7s39 gene=Nk52_evmTU7s39